MNVFFALVLINSLCEFLHGNFSVTFPEAKISSSKFAETLPEVGISSSKFAETLPEVGISSSRLVGAFPEVGISSSRLAGAFLTCEITLCRLANIFLTCVITLCRLANIFLTCVITLCRLANIFLTCEITLCRFANIIPRVGMAFRRTGSLNLSAEKHANNRNKMENNGNFSFNNDIEYNFLIIQNENVIRGLVLRNRNRLSGFYNNFLINQNF